MFDDILGTKSDEEIKDPWENVENNPCKEVDLSDKLGESEIEKDCEDDDNCGCSGGCTTCGCHDDNEEDELEENEWDADDI